MKGAKGVIVSITGGDDMRLMEVDEAANHIRELVDPDANIIWGSAFNPDLEGKIRVSVVATGIDGEALHNTEDSRPFSLSQGGTRSFASGTSSPTPAPSTKPSNFTPAPAAAEPASSEPEPLDLGTAGEPLVLDDAETGADELLLDAASMEADAPTPDAMADASPLAAKAPRVATGGGTLFERMSSLSRGGARDEEDDGEDSADAPPLNIPRFLGRQNNQ